MPLDSAVHVSSGLLSGILDGAGGVVAIAALVVIGVILIRRYGALE
jgi:hypothetical protein